VGDQPTPVGFIFSNPANPQLNWVRSEKSAPISERPEHLFAKWVRFFESVGTAIWVRSAKTPPLTIPFRKKRLFFAFGYRDISKHRNQKLT
jgi:hypothetical protein